MLNVSNLHKLQIVLQIVVQNFLHGHAILSTLLCFSYLCVNKYMQLYHPQVFVLRSDSQFLEAFAQFIGNLCRPACDVETFTVTTCHPLSLHCTLEGSTLSRNKNVTTVLRNPPASFSIEPEDKAVKVKDQLNHLVCSEG
jgi:hypothetical protein